MKDSETLRNGKLIRNNVIFPVIVGIMLLIAIFPAFLFGIRPGLLAVAVFVVYAIIAVVFILIRDTDRKVTVHLILARLHSCLQQTQLPPASCEALARRSQDHRPAVRTGRK